MDNDEDIKAVKSLLKLTVSFEKIVDEIVKNLRDTNAKKLESNELIQILMNDSGLMDQLLNPKKWILRERVEGTNEVSLKITNTLLIKKKLIEVQAEVLIYNNESEFGYCFNLYNRDGEDRRSIVGQIDF
jgi:hypothetical protein